MTRVWWFLLLVACGESVGDRAASDGPVERWVDYPPVEAPRGVETRFLGRPTWTPTAEEEAAIMARCPRITSGTMNKETESVWLAQVRGERLDELIQVGALLDGDKLVTVGSDRVDEVVRFPVACEQCTIVFGIDMGADRLGACTGPSHSLTVHHGKLLSDL